VIYPLNKTSAQLFRSNKKSTSSLAGSALQTKATNSSHLKFISASARGVLVRISVIGPKAADQESSSKAAAQQRYLS
jgi:hypothetical protein